MGPGRGRPTSPVGRDSAGTPAPGPRASGPVVTLGPIYSILPVLGVRAPVPAATERPKSETDIRSDP